LDSTPDFGYFGPAPNFSAGLSPDGLASAGSFVADAFLAFKDVFKQNREIAKEKERYEATPSGLQTDVMNAYWSLLTRLQDIVKRCAPKRMTAKIDEQVGLTEAERFFSCGLNELIADKAWHVLTTYRWFAVVQVKKDAGRLGKEKPKKFS